MEQKLFHLSSNKTQMVIEILNIISEEDKYYSVSNISLITSMSDRTIQRYLVIINEVIDNYNHDKESHFKLEQNIHGVKLRISEKANINFLNSYLLQKEDTIKFLIALFVKKFDSTNDYMNHYFIGINTVNKAINNINDFFSEFDLVVDRKNFNILGNEVNIRFLMHNVFWLVYRCDSLPDPFKIIDQKKLYDDIDHLIESSGISNDNVVKEKDLIFRIAISLLRYRKKCYVKLSDQQKEIIPKYMNSYGNPTLYEIVEKLLGNHSIVNTEEINYLILSFLNNNILYTSKSLKKHLFDYHKEINSDIYKSTNLFLEKFQYTISEIPLEKSDIVYDFVFRSHIVASIHQHKFNDYNSDIFDTIKDKYPEYVNQLKLIINDLKDSESFVLFNNDNYLLNRYVMLNYFLNLNFLNKRPIKLQLLTDFTNIYEEYIKDYIIIYFKNDYKLQFLDSDIFHEPDLILSNSKTDTINSEYVTISYPLKKRELSLLKNKFDKIINFYNTTI